MSKTDKPYVLVVDDDEATCTLITALLQRDFDVEVSGDAVDALEKLRTKEYGAILLDLRMPQYDGYVVLDFLKESHPERLRSVLVVSAMLSPREVDRLRAYNVCGFIAKPFDVNALLDAVRQCIGGSDGPQLSGIFCSPVLILLAGLIRRSLS